MQAVRFFITGKLNHQIILWGTLAVLVTIAAILQRQQKKKADSQFDNPPEE